MKIESLLCYLLFLMEVYSQQTYPYVSFMGQTLVNHSYVDLSEVGYDGSGSDSVQCITDLTTCCSSIEGPHRGDWYYPDGNRLPFGVMGSNSIQSRLPQRVDLRNTEDYENQQFPVGIYRCSIPTVAVHDDSNTLRAIVYVGLYRAGGGDITISGDLTFSVISDVNGPSPQFTLTCISTGGPATTVTWTRDSTILTEGTETVLNNPVTAQYTHTLTVTGRIPGLYTCTVANNKPSSDSRNISVTFQSFSVSTFHTSTPSPSPTSIPAPPPPSGIGLQKRGEGTLEVTWTPSEGSTVTGYIIYYQLTGEEEMSVMVNGRTTVSTNITGLSAGTYFVSMRATSTALPSSRTSSLTIHLGEGDDVTEATVVESSNQSPDSIPAIIGGVVVAIAFIIATAITVIAVVALILKYPRENTSTDSKTGEIRNTTDKDLELSKLKEPTYVDPDQVQTSSNEAYNIVKVTGGTGIEGEHEIPEEINVPHPPFTSTSSPQHGPGDNEQV